MILDRLISVRSEVQRLDDVEWYLQTKPTQTDHAYLQAIDPPVRGRAEVVNELEYMGSTASSLLPGLSGACDAMTVRNFLFHNPIQVGEDKTSRGGGRIWCRSFRIDHIP